LKTICAALEHRRVCRFVYDGKPRTVEIYCHGWSRQGKKLVRVYELSAPDSDNRWKLFDVSKMIGFEALEEYFVVRGDYRPRDPAIVKLCCGINR
jgi:hypothetical protein